MSDPVDELSRFGKEFEGGDMPLSAAAVRRRGDQIRRRRNALVAGGAALAVAAIATPILALGGSPKADRGPLTDDPTDGVAVTLSQDDLITDDDTEHNGLEDWFTTHTGTGDGQAPAHPCARSGYAELGAAAVLQRDFEMRNTQDPSQPINGDYLNETIAQFDSPAAARKAYDTVAEWVLECESNAITGYTVVPTARTVQVTGGDAVIYDSQWDYPQAEYEEAYIAETGIALVGDRIAVLTLHIVGQDYDFLPEEGGTPMERMLPRAAERLAPEDGAPPPTDAPSTDASAGHAGIDIPDSFPLAAGRPGAVGDGTQEGASRDLPPFEFTVCGEIVADQPVPHDPLRADWRLPEAGCG